MSVPAPFRECRPGRAAGRRPSAARGGFTLAELLVILVILGMLATLTFVSWKSVLPSSELNSAVRQLAGTLSEARSDAIARNAEFYIEYYFEEAEGHPRGYRVVTPYRRGAGGGLAFEDEERQARSWVKLPETVVFQSITVNGKRFTTGKVSVRFDPLGAASDHLIVLEQPQYQNLFTIEVLALTGLIRFHDGVFTRELPEENDFL
jgi:Tfp pilus assembly protein FimT